MKINSIRELTPHRSYKLFQDQLDKIKTLEDKYGISINVNELVREGVDLALELALKELEK